MRKLHSLFASLFFFFASGLSFAAAIPVNWQPIAPGLDYLRVELPSTANGPENPGSLHAFRVDLKRYNLKLAFANQQHQQSAFVSQLAQNQQAILGINGGFFSPAMQPLGLRISDGQLLHPAKNISWWGIFTIQRNQPYILSSREAKTAILSSFALQAGPRLLIQGRIPPLKPGVSYRSGIGITADHHIIIAVTDRTKLTTNAFAQWLRDIGCIDALNLDGGTSSQLYANLNHFTLHIASLRSIAEAIIVIPKKN